MSSLAQEIEKADTVTVLPHTAVLGPMVANIAFVIELTLVPLLLPAIQLNFSLTIGDLAWVFNSYGIAVAVGVILGGWFGDAFDTKKVFLCGIAFFVAGSCLVAAAHSFEALLVGRALQGFGGGVFSPLVPLLLTLASPRKPGRALIVWGSISGCFAAFAPLIYGSFLGSYGWNLAFFCIAALGAVAFVILHRTAITGAPALNCRPRMDYLGLFRARNLWITFAYVFCTYGSITYYLFKLPVWLSNYQVQAADVGLVLTIMWLTFAGLSSLLRNMVDTPHIRIIMVVAPLLIAAGLFLSFRNDNLTLLAFSSVLIGSGLACSNAPSTQMVLRFAPKGMSSISTSLDITFARLGGIATVAMLADTGVAVSRDAIFLVSLVSAICALTTSKGLADIT